MYTEKVMDHFEHPRNVGELENPSGVGTVGNAKCGDIMRIYLDVDENQIIRDVKFKTFGCGAAVATSSMATEMVKGKSIQDAMKVTNKAVMEALDGLPPVKVHCSLLAEEAIHAALWDYAQKNGITIEGLEKPKDNIEEEEEEEKPPLSPEKKKKRRNIAILITFLLLLCLGIGIALGMKRMKDLDRQEKEYYEKLHKEVVHQDTPSEEIEKEVDETEKQDAAQEETTKQERFQLVNPDEIDFSQYQKIVPVSTEQNSIKESDTYDYSAQSAVDGDSSTSWQENEENTGETTGIRINFDGNHKVRYLVLYLGNWRSDQLWEYSARPKTLTIQVGDSETKDIEFSDEKKKFCLSFEEPIDASYISMYIADSYEGSRWNDNGISEVEIYE